MNHKEDDDIYTTSGDLTQRLLLEHSEKRDFRGLEGLRQSFKPSRVRTLLIGESPPAGGTFFYCGNSHLYFNTKRAFEAVNCREYRSTSEFLTDFMDKGFYLDDLCREPVNNVLPNERRKARIAGVLPLSVRIETYNPDLVVCVMRSIARDVEEAALIACIERENIVILPFPAQGHHREFVEGLVKVIRNGRGR